MSSGEEKSFINSRKQKLIWNDYKPSGDPLAIYFFHTGYPLVVTLHTKYFEKLAEQGLWAFTYDHHGHGRSDPQKPKNLVLEDYNHLKDDSIQFINEIVIPEAQKAGLYKKIPLLIGGESMGGLSSCLTALDIQKEIDGVVLLAPAIGMKMDSYHKFLESIAGFLNSCVPKMRLVSITRPELSFRDQGMKKVLEEDPYVDPGNMRVRTGYQLLQAQKYLEKNENKLDVPMLILFGDQDKMCAPEPAERLLNSNQNNFKEIKYIKDGWHCLIADPDSTESVKETVSWIQKLSQNTTQQGIKDSQSNIQEQNVELNLQENQS